MSGKSAEKNKIQKKAHVCLKQRQKLSGYH